MAYKQEALKPYLAAVDQPYVCTTCPYCNGTRDATVKFPENKPLPWEFWKNNLGSPKFVVAPMVDASELPFRMLCMKYGATLCYSPMYHAKNFATSAEYRRTMFTTIPRRKKKLQEEEVSNNKEEKNKEEKKGEESEEEEEKDRPLFVQFCGNDADTVLSAAKFVETGGQCDAVDINLGCPQGIAKRGFYGSFLMEHWDVIHTIIHTLRVELAIPVTAKMRVFDQEGLTLKYAKMLRDAGAHVITVHGRTREMKGGQTGVANLEIIKKVKESIPDVPIIANGNILQYSDAIHNLDFIKCDAVMSAEALLWDPRLFSNPKNPVLTTRLFKNKISPETRVSAVHTALEYLQFVAKYPVDLGIVKAHMFKMLLHSLSAHVEMRDALGKFECIGVPLDLVAPVDFALTNHNTDEKWETCHCVAVVDETFPRQSSSPVLQKKNEEEMVCDNNVGIAGVQPGVSAVMPLSPSGTASSSSKKPTPRKYTQKLHELVQFVQRLLVMEIQQQLVISEENEKEVRIKEEEKKIEEAPVEIGIKRKRTDLPLKKK